MDALCRRTGILAWMILLALSAGCAGTRVSTPLEDAKDFLQPGTQPSPEPVKPPPEVQSALVPPLHLDARSNAPAPSQRFDVNVDEVPAREFFMGLVQGTPYNMVVHPGVEGTITLNLKRVTIPEVMAIAQKVYGYEFERTAYGFEVLPVRLRSRLYHVNYLNMVRSGLSETQVSSGQVSDIGPRGGGTGSGVGTPSDGSSVVGAGSSGLNRVTGTRIKTKMPETRFWEELRTSILAIIGSAPGRSVVVNPESGVIVVRAMPRELREVEDYLLATEAVAGRQVILEAKILEVELSDAYQTGIDWEIILREGTRSLTFATEPFGSVTGEEVDSIVRQTAARAFGGVFSAELDTKDVDSVIDLLKTQGSVQVLSSPRVSTMNNQQAVIKVGNDEYFVTNISSTTVTGVSTTTIPNVELTPFFSGIALDVTPQIGPDGVVTLHIHPSVTEVDEQRKRIAFSSGQDGQDEGFEVPLAFTTVRESDSIVRARSGQVVVIGGLMSNELKDDRAGAPGIDEIPGINRLFRQQRGASRKTELVILLRPIVVGGADVWRRDIGRARQEFERLDQAIKAYQER